MAKSKQSEEEIIKLGKKLVQELSLETSVNTLGRWMAHYVTELIYKAENTTSQQEKELYQKECCDVILRLWNNKEHLPDSARPLSELKPFFKVLDSLKKKNFLYPNWLDNNKTTKDTTWDEFTETINDTSKEILEICLCSTLSSNILNKEQEWIKEHKEMLDEDEFKMIELIDNIINGGKMTILFVDDNSNSFESRDLLSISQKDRYEQIFNKIETNLEKQRIIFQSLKESILKNIE